METRLPTIGDRVFFLYGAMCGEATGKVVAFYGESWGVQMDEEPSRIESINQYVGTAEDRGGYCVALQPAGIGVYLVQTKATSFRELAANLGDRVYPKRPTVAQTRAILVETGTASPSDRMIEDLRDEADDLIDGWFRDANHESECESSESRRTERDYV